MSVPCVECGVKVKYLPGQNYAVILGMLRRLNPKMMIAGFKTYCGDCWRGKKA